MVKKAFFRANIPFTLSLDFDFEKDLSQNGWSRCDIQGDFLLKHINTSFDKNVVCYTKQTDNIVFEIPSLGGCEIDKKYKFAVTELYAFCFDTGVGIVSLHIPYDNGIEEDTLANVCSILRCSAKHKQESRGCPVITDGRKTYLSCIAEEQLTTLLGEGFTLFDLFNDNSQRRIDMFSAVLCDKNADGNAALTYDRLCYRLANTLDCRDGNLVFESREFLRRLDYTRWCFSKRGCAVVSNLTGVPANDGFLENMWFLSVKSNYFYLYLMVLHQKYAIYNYLDTVAADTEKTHLRFNQESLIDFNSKYVFAIVSDEPLIQNTYLRMKEVNNVDEVYSDLLDELKRMFEYSQLKNNEINETKNSRLNIISLVISALCSISIVFDTINIFTANGFKWGLGSKSSSLFTVTIVFEVIALIASLAVVFWVNKKKK